MSIFRDFILIVVRLGSERSQRFIFSSSEINSVVTVVRDFILREVKKKSLVSEVTDFFLIVEK